MEREKIREEYLSEAGRLKSEVDKEGSNLLVLSVLRLTVFVSGAILTWIGFISGALTGLSMLIVSVSLFLFLIKLYGEHTRKKNFLGNLMQINLSEAAAISGDMNGFANGSGYINRNHFFSYDVDLFGDSSLFQFLNRTVTGYGRDILAGWLEDPFTLAPDLNARQEAVRELSIKKDWRHKFLASGMEGHLEKDGINRFEKWLMEESGVRSTVMNFLLIYILPVLSVASLTLVVTGVLNYTVFTTLFIFNLLVVSSGIKATNRCHKSVTGMYNYLSSLRQLVMVFSEAEFSSSILSETRKNIIGGEVSAAVALNKMAVLLNAFDTRLNIIAGFLLNGLLMWDYQCIRRLDRWKRKFRNSFPQWLEMTGRIDAYVSLANFAFNNPDYAFPGTDLSGKLLFMKDSGHPLITEDKRISNDFEIVRRGEICVITGANMAGKSTFLRSVAVNYILAMTGAPVCASEMQFIPMKLFTSMRTTDSLSGNESYFYAELKRLRQLKTEIESGEPLFFILDEILKGTNSADKSIGSKMFMKRIIDLAGTGLIATHDISLGDLENEFPGSVFNMCFEVDIIGEMIGFDYKLRPGITKKMNAAILMKQMGILD